MQAKVEQALQIIQSLSAEDYERLWRWMLEHHNRRQEQSQILNGTRTKEERTQSTQKWLAENRSRYAGEWIALDGDRLISHGRDGRKVLAEAKASGVKNPFFDSLIEDELPFGGW